MAEGITIGMCTPEEGIFSLNLFRETLSEKGISPEHYEHVVDALPHFTQKQYPLILTAFEIAPGRNLEINPELKELWERVGKNKHNRQEYGEIGLYLVRKIRQSEANKNTPIIVADMFDSKKDSIHGSVQTRCLEAGATSYFSIWERKGSALDELADEIVRMVRRS